jgi:hypothetical protein
MKHLPLSRILMTAALVTGVYMLAAGKAGAADKAGAEAKRDAQIDSRFAAADKDKNGKLTLEEAKAGMPRVAKNFDKIKTGSNDYVTIDEVKAASKKAP